MAIITHWVNTLTIDTALIRFTTGAITADFIIRAGIA
jgi:hypothetical protein